METPAFITTRRLHWAYASRPDHRVLTAVDLALRPAEYLLLCGASGSGKSTLGRTFNGLIPHFYPGRLSGEVRVATAPTAARPVNDLFRHVGMVFQNPETQLFNRTVEREIAFGLESLGLHRTEIRRRIDEAAAQVGLRQLLGANPQTLSGGQQQLVTVAAVLATRPQMLFLDEPYANLDPTNVDRLRRLLRALHARGTGIIVSEHRLTPAASDAGRMLVLHRGRVVCDGPPRELLNTEVAAFGLEAPLAAVLGRRAGLTPLPLDIEELRTRLTAPLRFDTPPPAPPPPPSAAPLLNVEGLTHRRGGATLLADVRLTLCPGECLAVVGPNGAGKTTLLKHLNGLLRPSAGRLQVCGRDSAPRKVSDLARDVGIAFQNPDSQFFRLTVRDEIEVGARALDRYDPRWIDELVDLLQLGDLLPRAPFRLSSGEKKRVAFAAALASRPAVLALDEPTAGQDFDFRQALVGLLRTLTARGQAVVLVTQDLAFAEQAAHRWLLLAAGRVLACGPSAQVMADSAAMQQAGLVATERHRLREGSP